MENDAPRGQNDQSGQGGQHPRPRGRGFFRRRPKPNPAAQQQQQKEGNTPFQVYHKNQRHVQHTPEKLQEDILADAAKKEPPVHVAHGEMHMNRRPHNRRQVANKVNKFVDNMYARRVPEPQKNPFTFFKEGWDPLRVIPIGGLEEVGGNAMILEYGSDMIIVDAGMLFSGQDLPGVNYVIPDLTYAFQNKQRLRAIVITHGHLDHIGALQHILPKLPGVPIYAPKFAIGLMEKSLTEVGIWNTVKPLIHRYVAGDSIPIGKFTVETFQQDHSLPDSFGLYIQTPVANIIHSGDFRMDMKKVQENHPDIQHMRRIADKGVDLLMADSTNSIVPGHPIPEEDVLKNLEDVIANAEGRIFLATFSTLVSRVQGVIDIAKKYNRKVYLNGRSMLNNTILARDLGYIKYNEGDVKRVTKHIAKVPDNQVIVVTTGSQGEPNAGLTRIALGAHPILALKEGDTVIHSARVIPENSGKLLTIINAMMRKNANVLFKFNYNIPLHTSGHGYQGDLVEFMNILRPKNVMPLHGELFMRREHAKLAITRCNIPAERTHMVENGDALEICKGEIRIIENAISLTDVIVENGYEGDITDPVIMERLTMKENGVIVVMLKVQKSTRKLTSHPKIISRGFAFRHLSEKWNDDIVKLVKHEYEKVLATHGQKRQKDLIGRLRATIARQISSNYDKTPIVLPIIIEQ